MNHPSLLIDESQWAALPEHVTERPCPRLENPQWSKSGHGAEKPLFEWASGQLRLWHVWERDFLLHEHVIFGSRISLSVFWHMHMHAHSALPHTGRCAERQKHSCFALITACSDGLSNICALDASFTEQFLLLLLNVFFPQILSTNK